jgi:hypothetical protein
MRALLILVAALTVTGCSSLPPQYTAKIGLLEENPNLDTPNLLSSEVEISAKFVVSNGVALEIAEHYVSALGQECIRLVSQKRREIETPIAVCKDSQSRWYAIGSLN